MSSGGCLSETRWRISEPPPPTLPGCCCALAATFPVFAVLSSCYYCGKNPPVTSRMEREAGASLLQRLPGAGCCRHLRAPGSPVGRSCVPQLLCCLKYLTAGGFYAKAVVTILGVGTCVGDVLLSSLMLGKVPTEDGSQHAGAWDAGFPHFHPLCMLAGSSTKRHWVGAGHGIRISGYQVSVITAQFLLMVTRVSEELRN